MDQLPARGAERAEAQLTLPASGLAGQACSFLLRPLRPGLEEGVGAGWTSRKATHGVDLSFEQPLMQLFLWVSGTVHRVAAAGTGS